MLLASATCYGWSTNDYSDEDKAKVDLLTLTGGTAGDVLTLQGDGTWAPAAPGAASMVYPGAGIAVSTGSAWGTSITNNSANWDTAYGWGNHVNAGYLTTEIDPSALKATDIGVSIQAYSANMDTDYTDDFDGSYSSLSDVPLSFTPASHGNEAHSSTFITAGDVPANETDGVFSAWLLATPPLYSEVDGSTTNEIQTASTVAVTTTNFGGHLANDATSDTVQECLDLLDDIVSGGLAETDIDTSSEIATIVTDETGTGALCFATSPDITTPAITDLSTEPAASGDITITLAQSKRGILTDKSLTGNADFVLDDEDAYLTVHIYIVDGTDTISLVPPSGECLMMDGAFLDANDEVDLSSTEGDKFVLVRRYSTAKTDYVWDIETVRGTATDGGAGD